MTRRIRILYDGGRKNTAFSIEIYEADLDKKPSFFSSSAEKHFFAMVYYGWLVGKYKNEWKNNI